MLDISQHAPLVIRMLNLLHLDNLGLLQYLDGIESLVVFRLNQVNTTEATSSERPQNFEIGQRVLALGNSHHGSIAGLLLVVHLMVLLLLLMLELLLLLLLRRGLRHLLLLRWVLLLRLLRRLRHSLLLLRLHGGGVSSRTNGLTGSYGS